MPERVYSYPTNLAGLLFERADNNFPGKAALFDLLPNECLIGIKEVCFISSRSPASIRRDVKAGRLAPPLKIGNKAIRWRVCDVRRFIKGGA